MTQLSRYATTTRGFRTDILPWRLYQRAKQQTWDPADIDLSQDAADWAASEPARQRIVARLVLELVLQTLALRDVPMVRDDAGDARVMHEVRQPRLDPAPLPVDVVTQTQLDHAGAGGDLDARPVRLLDHRQVVRVHQPRPGDALQFALRHAHDLAQRRTRVGDRAVRVVHRDRVRGVAHERPEALLAAAQLGGQTAPVERHLDIAREACQRLPVLVVERFVGLGDEHHVGAGQLRRPFEVGTVGHGCHPGPLRIVAVPGEAAGQALGQAGDPARL
jgi:hypothetical protein